MATMISTECFKVIETVDVYIRLLTGVLADQTALFLTTGYIVRKAHIAEILPKNLCRVQGYECNHCIEKLTCD